MLGGPCYTTRPSTVKILSVVGFQNFSEFSKFEVEVDLIIGHLVGFKISE